MSKTTDLVIGGTVHLRAKITPADAKPTVTWELHGSPGQFGLEARGETAVVRALQAGSTGTASANVIARGGGKSAEVFTVRIKPRSQKIEITPANPIMLVGESLELTATAFPAEASQAIGWNSSHIQIVDLENREAISTKMKIHALDKGRSFITAYSRADGRTDSCRVDVVNSLLEKAQLNAWSHNNSLPQFAERRHGIRYISQSSNYFFPSDGTNEFMDRRASYHEYLWKNTSGYTLGCAVASTSVSLDLMGVNALPWEISERNITAENDDPVLMQWYRLSKWDVEKKDYSISELSQKLSEFHDNPSLYSPPVIGYTLNGWAHYIVLLEETETKGVFFALDSSINSDLFDSNTSSNTMYSTFWRFEKT